MQYVYYEVNIVHNQASSEKKMAAHNNGRRPCLYALDDALGISRANIYHKWV